MANEGASEGRVDDLESEFQEKLRGLGQIDWFLSELVEMAELGFNPPVVLTVGGAHVSGKLISGSQYFLDAAKLFEDANLDGNEAIAAVVRRFKLHAEDITRPEDLSIGDIRRYIHLGNARFYSTDGKSLPANGVNMRFKLTAVEGFSFGGLKATEY